MKFRSVINFVKKQENILDILIFNAAFRQSTVDASGKQIKMFFVWRSCVFLCLFVCHSEYLVPANALLYCVCTEHSVCRLHKPVLALCWTLVQKDGDRRWPCNRTIPHSHDQSRGARYLCLFWRNWLPPTYTLYVVRHVVTSLCILSFLLCLRTVPESSVHTVSQASLFVFLALQPIVFSQPGSGL
jgi:hypothetical protein